jgi:signal transduction histidine kinase
MASIGLAQGTQPVLRFWRGLGGRTTTTTAEHQSLIPNIRASVETIDIAPDALFAGRAFVQQRPVFSANIRREDPTNAAMYAVLDIQAVLAAPISAGDRRLGVLTLWASRAPVFAESDLELLQLLARQVAVVLESRTLLQEVAAARAHDQAEDLKDRFLASISHDLRNPLTAAAVRAQLLRRRLDRLGSVAYDELHDGLRSIEKSHAQMARLIDQLLDYARLQLDRPLELNREPTDLVEMVRDVVASHASTSDGHQVQLEPDVRSLVGQWDRDRLERVLQNVMSNAIKYSPAGGVIRVAIRHEQSAPEAWATVIVEDHGLGIPSAELPRIFEGFHRAANVSQIAGTGIGLATARDVVERHGGEIIVDSEEGRGSTFTIRLPVIPPGADRDEDGLSEG